MEGLLTGVYIINPNSEWTILYLYRQTLEYLIDIHELRNMYPVGKEQTLIQFIPNMCISFDLLSIQKIQNDQTPPKKPKMFHFYSA